MPAGSAKPGIAILKPNAIPWPQSMKANPFQKISVDFVGPLQPSSKGNTHILTVKDSFSRWLEAYPTRDTTSKNIASILSRNIFCRFGMPEQIHSDQGPNFVSKLIRSMY